MCGRLLEAIGVKIILRTRLSKIVSFADYLDGSGYLDSGWKGSGFLDYWSFYNTPTILLRIHDFVQREHACQVRTTAPGNAKSLFLSTSYVTYSSGCLLGTYLA